MNDREKVIKELHRMADVINQYDDMLSVDNVDSWVILDALDLLKEQEAVEPSFKQDEKGIFIWCCGSCGAYMYHIYDGIDKAKEYAKYCRQCGKKVKWE